MSVTRKPLHAVLGGLALAVVLAPLATSRGSADDAVIMKDGYTFTGRVFKERTRQPDGQSPFTLTAPFDGVDSGTAFTYFSMHKDRGCIVKKRTQPDYTVQFNRQLPNDKPGTKELPGVGEIQTTEFNVAWRRTMEIKFKGGASEKIEQMITHMDPKKVYVVSWTHRWGQVFDTREFGYEQVIKLLRTHPDLKEGWIPVVDPVKRLTIAQFLLEAGWTYAAREEIARLKKEVTWAWPKEANERCDKLLKDLDIADSTEAVAMLDRASKAGQYESAAAFLAAYKPKAIDDVTARLLADVKARIETVRPRYELGRRLLRDLIDREGGTAAAQAHAAAGGGFAYSLPARNAISPQTASLLEAAEAVYAELHPDSIGRVDTFIDAAATYEESVKTGKTPSAKPTNLLGLAVSGWLRGKGGAQNDPAHAVRCWETRVMAMKYLRQPSQNDRTGYLNDYMKSSNKLGPDELAQIVSMLPPIDPEDPANIRGEKVKPADALGVRGIVKVNSGPVPEDRAGVNYMVRLPPEYHHGRSYPLVVAITHPKLDPEKMLAMLAPEADRNGYILVAPVWTSAFGNPRFDLTGKDHPAVTGVVRDACRKYQVDPDRVFAFGLGEGANFALDLSMSRPDLFAGVVCFGPIPPRQFYTDSNYVRNAQLLPVYVITGEMAGGSVEVMRSIFSEWLRWGYPSLLKVYKGRGAEWYAGDVPSVFDWMNPKTRVRGNAALRLTNDGRFDPWASFRETDNRYYWIGVEGLSKGNLLTATTKPEKPPIPAEFSGNIRTGNEIVVSNLRGVKKVSVWLERDMIDWNSPLKITVKDSVTPFKTEILKPDVSVMFEELYRTGDRKLLFFGKKVFDIGG